MSRPIESDHRSDHSPTEPSGDAADIEDSDPDSFCERYLFKFHLDGKIVEIDVIAATPGAWERIGPQHGANREVGRSGRLVLALALLA